MLTVRLDLLEASQAKDGSQIHSNILAKGKRMRDEELHDAKGDAGDMLAKRHKQDWSRIAEDLGPKDKQDWSRIAADLGPKDKQDLGMAGADLGL